MSNNIIQFTTHNPIDKVPNENEDALKVKSYNKNSIKLVAISDGAGGVGIYCKQWAEYIVNNAPENIPNTNLNSWLINVSKNFYYSCKLKINQDNLTQEKFLTSGSYATILFLWIDYKKMAINYIGIGDTCLFILRKNDNGRYLPVIIYPIHKNEFIDQNPSLINWKKNTQIHEPLSFKLQKGDIIIAGTDAISRWVLEQLLLLCQNETLKLLHPNFKADIEILEKIHLSNSNLKSVEDIFYNIPNKKQKAIKYFENLINKNCIEADDLTLYAEIIS